MQSARLHFFLHASRVHAGNIDHKQLHQNFVKKKAGKIRPGFGWQR